ncbi:MAG: glycosyltransferase family 39 protein [Kiritimatiellia bacterium]
MAKLFNSSAQNIVYHLEVGVGPAILKTTLYIIFMMLMALLFVATQYQGFKSPRAMDQAQLARGFAETGRLHTRLIRPGDLRYLEQKQKLTRTPDTPLLAGQPDLVNAPAYPLLLGTAFKVFNTSFPRATAGKFSPEQWLIIPLNLLFCFLSGLLVYLTGRQLFSPRVAFTSVTIVLLSAQLWAGAVSGTEISFALLCFMFAMWCLTSVLTADAQSKVSGVRLLIPVGLGALSLALLFLTRYAAIVMVPAYILGLFLGLKKRAWIPAALVVLILGVVAAPWVLRNLAVAGTPFGLAPHYAIQGEAQELYMRSYAELQDQDVSLFKGMIVRTLNSLHDAFTFKDIPLGSGMALCFFVATYFYAFQRKPVQVLRWCLLAAYGLLIPAAGIFGSQQLETAHLLFPLVILYGTAFFYLLLDRLQISVQIVSLSVVTLFVLLQAVPLLVTLMPPKSSSYPPYRAGDITLITTPFAPQELVCTDMPWATAWYGGQLSLYLPLNVDQFFEIHDRLQPVNGLYLTMLSRNRPYQSDLIRGNYQSWKPIMDLNPLPRGFPLKAGFPIRGGESVILADRNRWATGQE